MTLQFIIILLGDTGISYKELISSI